MTKKIIVAFALFIFAAACKEVPYPAKTVEFTSLNERAVEITDTVKFEGFIIGADLNRNEVYIQGFSKLKRKYTIQIVDTLTGQVKKEKQLPMGTHQSPTEFFNPSFMQFLGDRYIIIDQYSKILVYDRQLNYLYTNMSDMYRFFVDFYSKEEQTFFVIGRKRTGMKLSQNNIRIFRFPENKRPFHIKMLHSFTFKWLSQKNRENRKTMFLGSPWPSGNGFEKDGKIYYANYDEKKYYMYDLSKNREYVFVPGYLKPKTYSGETAARLKFYHSDGWEKAIFKRSNTRCIAVPHPEPLYHFGIYDIGENKIGIIGDIDPDKEIFQFRLDILDAVSGKYLESIWLPFGDGFIQNITDSARGMTPTFINIDRGYYLWNNAEGEDFIDYARITTFKINRETESTQ